MSPPDGTGPGHHPGTGATNLKATKPETQRTADDRQIVAFATLFLAAGSAHFDWLVVRNCPLCGFAHRHTRFERDAQTVERAPGCAPHRRYLVRVADVVPVRRQGRTAA